MSAILALAVAAILANQRSVLAIAEWGERQDAPPLAALGFPRARTPCRSTRQRLVRHLNGQVLAATVTACFAPSARPATSAPATLGVAIEGQAQRGRVRCADEGCPVHALSAFCHDQGVVLAHEPIAASPEAAAVELTVAPALLARIDWPGRVLTGDALFGQRSLCPQVPEAGGDSLLRVNANPGTH